MSRYLFTTLALCATLSAYAQIDRNTLSRMPAKFAPGTSITSSRPATAIAARPLENTFITTPVTSQPQVSQAHSRQNTRERTQTSNSRNEEDNKAQEAATPDTYPTYGLLHQGLNASIDLSVMAAFGRHAPQGAGFAQRLTATYLSPLGRHGWLAVGGYLNHLNWDGANITSGGLYAELGYQFNEHWAAYIYGQKALVNSGRHFYPAYYANGLGYYGRGSGYYYRGLGYYDTPYYNSSIGDKIGAAIRWTPNPNFSLQLSVERNWFPSSTFYEKQYDYPVPGR